MIFELAQDLQDALAAMPHGHPMRRTMELLEEAIRRDLQFVARHTPDYPHGLFQCVWNACAWLDDTDADDPDGPRGAFASRLWAAARRKEISQPGFQWLRSLRPPEDRVGSGQKLALRGRGAPFACSTASPRLACTNTFRDVEIWDMSTGALLHRLPFHVSHTMVHSTALALSPDGALLAQATNSSEELRLIDVDSERLLWRTTDSLGCVIDHLSFKPNGRELICAGGDSFALVDVRSGELLGRSRGERFHRFACQPDRARLACIGGTRRSVVLSDGTVESDLLESQVKLSAVAISADGARVATGNVAGEVEIFSLRDGACTQRLAWPDMRSAVTALSYAASGKEIVVGRSDGVVQIVDAGGRVLSDSRFHGGPVEQAALAATAGWVITGSSEGIAAWIPPTVPQPAGGRRIDHRGPVQAISFSEDDAQILSVAKGDLSLWDGTTGRLLKSWEFPVPTAESSRPGDLAERIQLRYHRAKGRAVVLTRAGRYGERLCVTLLKMPDPSILLSLGDSTGGRSAGDNALVGFGVSDSVDVFITWDSSSLNVWDVDSARVIREIRHSPIAQSQHAGAVSPDGRYVATGGDDGVVRVWSVHGGSCEAALSGHEKPVYLICWASSGKLIASASSDGWILVWDVGHRREMGRFRHNFDHHPDVSAVSALTISDDDASVISVGKSEMRLTSLKTTARVWDLRRGELAAERTGLGISFEGLADSIGRRSHVSADSSGVLFALDGGTRTIGRLPDAFADVSAVRRDGNGFAFAVGSRLQIFRVERGVPNRPEFSDRGSEPSP